MCFSDYGIFNTRGEFISTRGTGAGMKVFGRKKRCLGPRTGPARPYRQKMTGASSGVFGASSGVLVTPKKETFTLRSRVCPDILCTFPRAATFGCELR